MGKLPNVSVTTLTVPVIVHIAIGSAYDANLIFLKTIRCIFYFFEGVLIMQNNLKIIANNELMTVGEAAQYLRVSSDTIYHWTFKKMLPVVKLGRLSRYRRCDLDEFINKGLKSTNANQC